MNTKTIALLVSVLATGCDTGGLLILTTGSGASAGSAGQGGEGGSGSGQGGSTGSSTNTDTGAGSKGTGTNSAESCHRSCDCPEQLPAALDLPDLFCVEDDHACNGPAGSASCPPCCIWPPAPGMAPATGRCVAKLCVP